MLAEFKYVIYNKTKWINKLNEFKDNKLLVNWIDNANLKDDSYKHARIIRDAYLRVMQVTNYNQLQINNYLLLSRTASIIKLPESYEQYMKDVGGKTRNMIRKAEKNGIECKKIIWNDYLYDIYEINTSTKERQGKIMKPHYNKLEKREEIYCNEYHFIDTIGCIRDNKLIGYLYLRCHNDCAIISRFLGHFEHKSLGIMNKLVAGTVNLLINDERYKHVKSIIYLVWDDTGLTGFKKRCGFKPYLLYLKNIQNYESFIKINYGINNFEKLNFTDLNYNRTQKLKKIENIKINIIKPQKSYIPIDFINKHIEFDKNDIIIDIGSSNGFSTFILGTLNVKEVIGIEILNKFFNIAEKNKFILDTKKVKFVNKNFLDSNIPENVKLFYNYNSVTFDLIHQLILKISNYDKNSYILLKIQDNKVFDKYNECLIKYNFKKIDEIDYIIQDNIKGGSGRYYLYKKV